MPGNACANLPTLRPQSPPGSYPQNWPSTEKDMARPHQTWRSTVDTERWLADKRPGSGEDEGEYPWFIET